MADHELKPKQEIRQATTPASDSGPATCPPGLADRLAHYSGYIEGQGRPKPLSFALASRRGSGSLRQMAGRLMVGQRTCTRRRTAKDSPG